MPRATLGSGIKKTQDLISDVVSKVSMDVQKVEEIKRDQPPVAPPEEPNYVEEREPPKQ